ncbi:MAG: type II secretion system F family protein [Candidatus Pacearchaeota archaeon]|nr:type II secretion system F family protein [Candidatus Pacearchaeota archaeon]
MDISEHLIKIREIALMEKRTMKEFSSLLRSLLEIKDNEEKSMIKQQGIILKNLLRKTNNELLELLNEISFTKPWENQVKDQETTPAPEEDKPLEMQEETPEATSLKKPSLLNKIFDKIGLSSLRKKSDFEKTLNSSQLEQDTIKRLTRGDEKIIMKKEEKPSIYSKLANRYFLDYSKSLIKEKRFLNLEKDLIKSNLVYTPAGYLSILVLTVAISIIIAVFLFIFLLFFDISSTFPLITLAKGNMGIKFLKIFWILIVIPAGTFLFMYLFPSFETKSVESKINQELPFATIHMSSISGSMIEPSKIFSIIMTTKEYPYLEREFIKLLNEINIYGFDFVTALKNVAKNSPSQKLADLFNGLATTINTGGNLAEFFEKRSNSLLFEYRLDIEKQTKAAETFMDIYISVVIAAPMILMLLLMMMKISGLGMSLSTSMITILMIVGVSFINLLFLVFLHLKNPSK